jgi:hypothetical protein
MVKPLSKKLRIQALFDAIKELELEKMSELTFEAPRPKKKRVSMCKITLKLSVPIFYL